VLVAGTIGYVSFGLSLLDSVFQRVITVSTVGFGEARPFGPGEKIFTVVVDSSPERVATVKVPYVHGDATDEEVLRAAGIGRAQVLVTALNTDAYNLYVTLTARSMAGADRVVNPQDLGGARMAALAFQPHVSEFLDVVMHDGSLEQVEVPLGSPLAGETLRSARAHERTGTLVLAMRHPGKQFRTNPPPTAEIVAGDVLIVIGDAQQVAALRALAAGAEHSQPPVGAPRRPPAGPYGTRGSNA
jgi:voltage-gated potassium channel